MPWPRLLALTAARLPTRVGPDGVAQLLEDQPRSQWDRGLIALGFAHLERSAGGEELTVWHLRAEIASLHATAASSGRHRLARIAAIYDHLCTLDPSPVVELARAVAIGRADGAGCRPRRAALDRRQSLTSKRRVASSLPNSAGMTKRLSISAARSALPARRRTPAMARRLMERRLGAGRPST